MELLQTLNILLTIQVLSGIFNAHNGRDDSGQLSPSSASILSDSGYNGYRTPFPNGVA